MPPPLDNPFVLAAVVIGLVILIYAIKTSRKAKAELEQTRERNRKIIAEAKAKASQKLE